MENFNKEIENEIRVAVYRCTASTLELDITSRELREFLKNVIQRTGRSGSVVGNVFKMVFIRFHRREVRDYLIQLDINPTERFVNILKAVSEIEDSKRQMKLCELLGGAFQANILMDILKCIKQ